MTKTTKNMTKTMTEKVIIEKEVAPMAICLNCMKMVSDHCTARCPKLMCKHCNVFEHMTKNCPKKTHRNKDFTEENLAPKYEKDDFTINWGAHCDICKRGSISKAP